MLCASPSPWPRARSGSESAAWAGEPRPSSAEREGARPAPAARPRGRQPGRVRGCVRGAHKRRVYARAEAGRSRLARHAPLRHRAHGDALLGGGCLHRLRDDGGRLAALLGEDALRQSASGGVRGCEEVHCVSARVAAPSPQHSAAAALRTWRCAWLFTRRPFSTAFPPPALAPVAAPALPGVFLPPAAPAFLLSFLRDLMMSSSERSSWPGGAAAPAAKAMGGLRRCGGQHLLTDSRSLGNARVESGHGARYTAFESRTAHLARKPKRAPCAPPRRRLCYKKSVVIYRRASRSRTTDAAGDGGCQQSARRGCAKAQTPKSGRSARRSAGARCVPRASSFSKPLSSGQRQRR